MLVPIVEAHLCSIFAVAITAKEYSAAAAAFSAVQSPDVQARMVDRAMAYSFPKDGEVYAQWSGILAECNRLRAKRNKLAHGKLVPVVRKGGTIEWRFLPYYHFYTHKERDEFEQMKLSDLTTMNLEFRNLVGTMATFGKKIGARQEVKLPKKLVL